MGKGYHLGHMANKKAVGALGALTLCLVLLVLLVGTALGKYQQRLDSDNSVKALDFYFTSDFLDGTTHVLDADDGGSAEVTFTLANHADDLRFSQVDIDYTVTVEPADGGTVDSGVKVNPDSGNLKKDTVSDGTVTISGLKPGKTYTVKAVGTGGYEKTLTGTIQVRPKDQKVYTHLDTTNSEYVLLTVWAQNYTGTVTITPPQGKNLIPDNTDPVMETTQTGGTITDNTSFQSDGYASHTYRFFGQVAGISASDFTVTDKNGSEATVKAPTD